MVCEPLQPARAAKPSGFFHKALKWGNVASDNLFARGTEEGRGVFYELEKIHKVCLQGCTRQDTECCPDGEGGNVIPAFSPGCRGGESPPLEPHQSPQTTPYSHQDMKINTVNRASSGEGGSTTMGCLAALCRQAGTALGLWGQTSCLVTHRGSPQHPSSRMLTAHLDLEQPCREEGD